MKMEIGPKVDHKRAKNMLKVRIPILAQKWNLKGRKNYEKINEIEH